MSRSFMIFLLMVGLMVSRGTVFADEPPSWADFEVSSQNGEYIAKVVLVSPEEYRSFGPRGQYSLSVYKKAEAPVLMWSSPYRYDGYAGGHLSNDGSTFVYVNFWYDSQTPLVVIYRQGAGIKDIPGYRFQIDPSQLLPTVSHWVWLSQTDMPVTFQGNDFLSIKTIDGTTHVINLESGNIHDE